MQVYGLGPASRPNSTLTQQAAIYKPDRPMMTYYVGKPLNLIIAEINGATRNILKIILNTA